MAGPVPDFLRFFAVIKTLVSAASHGCFIGPVGVENLKYTSKIEAMAEKGASWRFKLQVDLPALVHHDDSPSSSSNQFEKAINTVLMPDKPPCASNIEIFVSKNLADLYVAQTSGSLQLEIQGFLQAKGQVRETALKRWLNDAEWTRVGNKLHKDSVYNVLLADSSSMRVQVHGEPQNKPGGRPRKVNTVKYLRFNLSS